VADARDLGARALGRNALVRRSAGWAFRGRGVQCTGCGHAYRTFFSALNDQCWWCGSLPRHRQIALLLNARPEMLWPGMGILHIAAEASVRPLLPRTDDYVAGDLDPRGDMRRVDVTAIDFEDERFDAVICNHVLEHVPDDRAAMSELHRVLKPGGWGIVMTPILRDVTDEDPAVTDPAERARRWGQSDHVRRYGWDYVDRLAEAGFEVDVQRDYTPDQVRRHVLCNNQGFVEPLFLVRRRA
jgi:SAM-dependent methyltransferase